MLFGVAIKRILKTLWYQDEKDGTCIKGKTRTKRLSRADEAFSNEGGEEARLQWAGARHGLSVSARMLEKLRMRRQEVARYFIDKILKDQK